jgi:hypothetical protein
LPELVIEYRGIFPTELDDWEASLVIEIMSEVSIGGVCPVCSTSKIVLPGADGDVPFLREMPMAPGAPGPAAWYDRSGQEVEIGAGLIQANCRVIVLGLEPIRRRADLVALATGAVQGSIRVMDAYSGDIMRTGTLAEARQVAEAILHLPGQQYIHRNPTCQPGEFAEDVMASVTLGPACMLPWLAHADRDAEPEVAHGMSYRKGDRLILLREPYQAELRDGVVDWNSLVLPFLRVRRASKLLGRLVVRTAELAQVSHYVWLGFSEKAQMVRAIATGTVASDLMAEALSGVKGRGEDDNEDVEDIPWAVDVCTEERGWYVAERMRARGIVPTTEKLFADAVRYSLV